MNRREFLGTAAVVSSSPLLLGMTRKSDDPFPVIGKGEYQYQCHHNWGELPKDFSWQTTHNSAFDSEGLVYITHQGYGKKMDTVIVFDPQGKFVRSFGKDWHGGAHGIEIRKEGSEEFVYLANTSANLKVAKTTLKGEVVWTQGRPECKEYEAKDDPKDPKKKLFPAYSPTNICFTPDGGFIVGDGYGSNYMLHYDKDAKLVKVFGVTGGGKGQIRQPHGQWVDDRVKDKPILLICDRGNSRLSRFGLDGTPLDSTESNTVVLQPCHAKTRGEVLIVPDLSARVSLLDKNNQPIVHLGDDEGWRKKVLTEDIRSKPKEWVAGKFVRPHEARFDKDGNILVTEWVTTGRVSFLKKVL